MLVLVVSPHADDETLGAGGSILKYKKQGHEVVWLNVTDMKEEYGYSRERISERQEEIQRVKQAYNIDAFYNLELKPAGLDQYSKSMIVQKMADIFETVQPEIVILPYGYDVHSDHKIVFEAALACAKVFRCTCIRKILCMEIISETDYAVSENGFVPNYYVNIDDYIEQKIKVAQLYQSEVKAAPFPRNVDSIRGLAQYRGAAAGAKYAEAFRVIKIIE